MQTVFDTCVDLSTTKNRIFRGAGQLLCVKVATYKKRVRQRYFVSALAVSCLPSKGHDLWPDTLTRRVFQSSFRRSSLSQSIIQTSGKVA